MPLKLPRLRFKLRTLVTLVALAALTLWAGLHIWSPTRRFARLLRSDQPVYVRREAAASLGRAIPPWEVDAALALLLDALHDPSPRVREYATVGLVELGPRAQQAASKLAAVLVDEDRFVRFAAARALGFIGEGKAPSAEVIAALTSALGDKDPDVPGRSRGGPAQARRDSKRSRHDDISPVRARRTSSLLGTIDDATRERHAHIRDVARERDAK
jgi:hypothetical protein